MPISAELARKLVRVAIAADVVRRITALSLQKLSHDLLVELGAAVGPASGGPFVSVQLDDLVPDVADGDPIAKHALSLVELAC